ncbi:hypothetical protein N431DRAFT_430213 [Stipitochalara longipes BDJ]|nr:hypothetical protein N431DRAFT_430213 [Stipitochalara longipes BDJ]
MSEPALPPDLEAVFTNHKHDPEALIVAFMHPFCNHITANRIFMQPRNPETRVCKLLRWRRYESIPWPAIPKQVVDEWFIEDNWEDEDPLWRAALQLKPSIYVEDLEKSAEEGTLNLEFESKYMFHTAFVHGHAHFPPLTTAGEEDEAEKERKFYGSVQPAVFDGPRIWSEEVRELVERCLVRIAPFMKEVGGMAPGREVFDAPK